METTEKEFKQRLGRSWLMKQLFKKQNCEINTIKVPKDLNRHGGMMMSKMLFVLRKNRSIAIW